MPLGLPAVRAWDLDKPSDDLLREESPHGPSDVRDRETLILQPRDVEVFTYVARHGVCTPQQLHRRFWPDVHPSAGYRRLQKLARYGYLYRNSTWHRGPFAIRVTGRALHAAHLPFHPIRLSWGRLPHQLALVDLSEELLAREVSAI